MLRITFFLLMGLAALSLNSTPAIAQEPFESIPASLTSQYRFNLEQYLFSSPEVEKEGRKRVYAAIEELEQLRGKVGISASNLERSLDLLGIIQSLAYKHILYNSLRYSINTRDSLSREEQTKFAAEVNKRLSFFSGELRHITSETFSRFVKQRPSLRPYSFAVEEYRRQLPYQLTSKESEIIAALNPYIQGWQGEFYNRVANPKSDWVTLQDNLAFVLVQLVKTRNALAQIRKHQNSPAEVYFNQYLSTESVKDVLDQLAKQSELHKRYEQKRISFLKKVIGREQIRFYTDFRSTVPGFTPRFSIGATTEIIKKSVASLGPEYQQEISSLFDPANGRMDIVPGPNRAPGGFTSGFPGSTKSTFYTSGFRGNFNDVIVVAHEAAHSVQFELMAGNHVMPVYTSGSDFLKESYGYFNELLLVDYLHQSETDEKCRIFYLDQFFERAFQIFNQAWATDFEQALYEGVEKGKISSAEDLNALMMQVGSRYSIWFNSDEDARRDWINIPHYFRNPTYRVNYLYARLLALKYYEMYKRDPKNFVPRYLALLSNGYDARPDILLKKFLDVDIGEARFVSNILDILNLKTLELESLYSR